MIKKIQPNNNNNDDHEVHISDSKSLTSSVWSLSFKTSYACNLFGGFPFVPSTSISYLRRNDFFMRGVIIWDQSALEVSDPYWNVN